MKVSIVILMFVIVMISSCCAFSAVPKRTKLLNDLISSNNPATLGLNTDLSKFEAGNGLVFNLTKESEREITLKNENENCSVTLNIEAISTKYMFIDVDAITVDKLNKSNVTFKGSLQIGASSPEKFYFSTRSISIFQNESIIPTLLIYSDLDDYQKQIFKEYVYESGISYELSDYMKKYLYSRRN